jgi:phosphohistidine swiveling domain-containing protein
MASEHTAHFRMTGADFTRIARERVLDDAPGHAWRIASCLGNDDGEDREAGVADAALAILKGTKKLVGDEKGMKLVKEHAKVTEKYLKEVNFIYAGRIRVFDKWYVPVAYVSDMGPRDMRNDHGKPVVRLPHNKGYSNRAWHYCGHDEIVVDQASHRDPEMPTIKREVIFRACGERPHWFEVPLTPQAALDEFLAAGHWLEERGHSKLYGNDEPRHWSDATGSADVSARANDLRVERYAREQQALKKGDVGPMNARLNAELELANELDEDDRPEVQKLRDDPQKGKRTEIIKRAYKQGLGVGAMAEMLDEYDPEALLKMEAQTPIQQEAERLRAEAKLAEEIEDDTAREAALEQIDREAGALRLRRLADLREAILKQADGDLLDLSWDAGMNHDGTEVRVPAGSAKVPRAPFLHWAFARMKMFADQLPPWTNVCPPGMKMPMDDQNHTDWVVGAGLDPENRELLYYPGPVAEAAMKLAHELQDKFDEPSDVHVLVDGPHVSGTVHHGKRKKPCPPGAIVVLPNLHPDFLLTIEDAAGVITEEGGAVAHLAQVGRERNLPIVRIEGALERFNPGDEIVIDTASRKVMGL